MKKENALQGSETRFAGVFAALSTMCVSLIILVALIVPSVALADGNDQYDGGFGWEDTYSGGFGWEDTSTTFVDDWSGGFGWDTPVSNGWYEDWTVVEDTWIVDEWTTVDYYDDYSYGYDYNFNVGYARPYYYESSYYSPPRYHEGSYYYQGYYRPPVRDYPEPNCVLEASRRTVEEGENVTLTWTARDADSATLTSFGSVSASSGSQSFRANSTRTYTLNVSGRGGSDTCSITIVVEDEDEDVVCEIDADDLSIEEGDDTTLEWSSDGADSSRINQGIGNVSRSGSRRVSPDRTTTYTLNVENDDGDEDTCSVTIRVKEEDDDLWCDISASDRTIEAGDDVTLRWETEGATDARINQGIGSVDEDGGTERVSPDSDTTYRLTVENDDGDEEECSVTIDVEDGLAPPPDVPLVFLSELPYTGTGMGPGTTMAYWMLIIAGAGVAGYFFLFRAMPFALARVEGEDEVTEIPVEDPAEVRLENVTRQDVRAFVSALTARDTDAAVHFAASMGAPLLAETAVILDDVIRARAQGTVVDSQVSAMTASWNTEKIERIVASLVKDDGAGAVSIATA